MTEAELKALAKSMGYNIIKIPTRENFLPCTCGCNRRTHWFISESGGGGCKLVCWRCGKQVWGKDEADAKHNWNEAIRLEQSAVHA